MTFKQSALCAHNALTRQWVPIALRNLSSTSAIPSSQPFVCQVQNELTLASWNIDAFTSQPSLRASHILNSLLERSKVPDILFFQEVTRDVYDFLLRDERVRKGFFATDAEDQTAFHGVPFTTVMLLSRMRFTPENLEETTKQGGRVEDIQIQLEQTCRMKLPSKYARDGLFVDVRSSTSAAIRLANVHLDSLPSAFHERSQQVAILSRNLRENGSGRGLIAGDFNAISPEDHKLVDENGLRDQWIALHGEESTGYTWGIHQQDLGNLPPGRLDKVATIGLDATSMEIIYPGKITVPRPGNTDDENFWSDHCGLICSFNI